jgi:hypothetical protein
MIGNISPWNLSLIKERRQDCWWENRRDFFLEFNLTIISTIILPINCCDWLYLILSFTLFFGICFYQVQHCWYFWIAIVIKIYIKETLISKPQYCSPLFIKYCNVREQVHCFELVIKYDMILGGYFSCFNIENKGQGVPVMNAFLKILGKVLIVLLDSISGFFCHPV